MPTFFGLIFNKDVEDSILLEYKDNLYKEVDLCIIYGRMSYTDAYNLPTIRRKIFINNFNYFKSLENQKIEEETKKNRNLNKNNLKFS